VSHQHPASFFYLLSVNGEGDICSKLEIRNGPKKCPILWRGGKCQLLRLRNLWNKIYWAIADTSQEKDQVRGWLLTTPRSRLGKYPLDLELKTFLLWKIEKGKQVLYIDPALAIDKRGGIDKTGKALG
jgi:hypothetical protein